MRSVSVKTRTTTEAGFSLIEIMLALAVIAIGLIAVVGLIPQGVQASRDAADNTLAATIAHDTFNYLRQQALQSPWPPTLTANTWYDAAATNGTTASASANTYFQVHLAASASTPNMLTVVATVTWPVKSASAVPPNTNIFVTSIANYQQ